MHLSMPNDVCLLRNSPAPILLDDPAAAALSLRAHMEPADLMELTLILAETAADALRDRNTPEEP
jgi:hypothetical protein